MAGMFAACTARFKGDADAAEQTTTFPALPEEQTPWWQDDHGQINSSRRHDPGRASAQPSLPVGMNHPDLLPIEASYVALEDDDIEKQRIASENRGLQSTIHRLKIWLAVLIAIVGSAVIAYVVLAYHKLSIGDQHTVWEMSLLMSIPIVAMLFTWFHIWLAIQMMFLPLTFWGIWQYRSTGVGIGWQGVVPRKAHKMAKTSYSCARPYLDGPYEWLTRVDACTLVELTRPHLERVIEASLKRVVAVYFPRMISEKGVRRTVLAAVEKVKETAPDLWEKIIVVLCDEEFGIDNDGMIVKVFMENKELLNDFFLRLGKKEFRFIEHCGAAMGFVCGLVQLIAFNNLDNTGRAFFLPVTGFFLGIVTNYLAILMVFKPCFPYEIKICGCHIGYIQGLFLKRQQAVSVLYSQMLCEHFLQFHKIVDYLQTMPELWEMLKLVYVTHNSNILRQSRSFAAKWLLPFALGKDQMEQMEEDLKIALIEEMYKADDMHAVAARYIGKVTNIEQMNCQALQRMPPDEFENLLHPVFKEDEWILVLLGGVLGAIVGQAQVVFLT